MNVERGKIFRLVLRCADWCWNGWRRNVHGLFFWLLYLHIGSLYCFAFIFPRPLPIHPLDFAFQILHQMPNSRSKYTARLLLCPNFRGGRRDGRRRLLVGLGRSIGSLFLPFIVSLVCLFPSLLFISVSVFAVCYLNWWDLVYLCDCSTSDVFMIWEKCRWNLGLQDPPFFFILQKPFFVIREVNASQGYVFNRQFLIELHDIFEASCDVLSDQ